MACLLGRCVGDSISRIVCLRTQNETIVYTLLIAYLSRSFYYKI